MQSVYGKKILVENPEKNRRKRQKTRKIGKNAVVFSIFGKIFQSFRKSYVLVPCNGERKWRQKSGKKSLTEGFSGNSRKNIQKIGISGEKRYCRKGVSGISESVKNSVLKALSDEMR